MTSSPVLDPARLAKLRESLLAASFTADGCLDLLGPTAYAALARSEAVPALRATRGGSPLETLVRLFLLQQPVPFESPDGNPVSLVFVLLVPEKATEKHLQILSELAQMFSDKPLREAMMQAPDAAALHQLISAWQPDAPGQRRAAA